MALAYPQIDPVIFGLGPFQVRWYGLMYVLGFIASYLLVRYQIRQQQNKALETHFENLNLTLIIGVIVGGRLGYVLFYNFSYYLNHPLEIFATWNGGMSFHGACLSLILLGYFFCRRQKLDFWQTADIYIVTIPIGLGLGRLGNFINGELWGRVTDVPWAMVFPGAGPEPRHPSQLYEVGLEGVVLFLLLWSLKGMTRKNMVSWPHGSMLALFLTGYGCARFLVEFFREPDNQLGFIVAELTMGQLLSGLMIASGILLWWIRRSSSLRQDIG